ncbi:dihydrofolate reductase family protein [Microbacterium sp. NPDC056044]|uniref:dihydrofolate reductase family protein n=1 Tax=Microbacterium sp. NPDC056044 TaxID=3345690 RepID=UPI0035D625A0
MAKVILYASMSVDGFATGPDDDLTVLHGWAFGDPTMAMHPRVTAEFFDAGAVIFGARTLRAGDVAWGDESIFPMPVFVPTHERRDPVVRNGALFTFVGSAEEALHRAVDAAGDRDVYIMGSADVARQLIAIDAVDVFELAITAVLLGAGVKLFDQLPHLPIALEPTRVLESKRITHIRYDVLPPGQRERGRAVG